MNWSYLFFSFDGRIARQPFWMAFGMAVACEALAHSVAVRIDGERLSAIVSLAFAYPEFAVCAKRGQDRNISPYVIGAFFLVSTLLDFLVILGLGGTAKEPSASILILTVPWLAFGLALMVDLGFRRGSLGPNRYGPDPLTATRPQD